VLTKNFKVDQSALAHLPTEALYIFPGQEPTQTLEQAKAEIGLENLADQKYTFKMRAMPPTKRTDGGEVRVVDSHNFPTSRYLAAALVILKPGAIRELHWHIKSEWQYYIQGKGRMTVFMPVGNARTMDFNANDIGYVPAVAGHYIENTGDTDLIFLETFATDTFVDISLNNWLRRLPRQMVKAHLGFSDADIEKIPSEKLEVI
jgi:oxalate decarboxylase